MCDLSVLSSVEVTIKSYFNKYLNQLLFNLFMRYSHICHLAMFRQGARYMGDEGVKILTNTVQSLNRKLSEMLATLGVWATIIILQDDY